VSESDARRMPSGFKRSSDADTSPIPVAQIQAKLAQESIADADTVVENVTPVADEAPERPGPMAAGTRVMDLPPPAVHPGPVADQMPPEPEPEPDPEPEPEPEPKPEPEPEPARPGPMSQGTAVVQLPTQPPVRPAPIPGRPAAAQVPPPTPPPPAVPQPSAPAPSNGPPVHTERAGAPPPARPDPRLNPPAPPPVSTPFTSAAPSTPPPMHGSQDPRMPSHTDLGLVRRVRPLPQSGWRKVVHRVTGLNPKESEQENTRQRLVARVSQPVRGDYSIAVLSMKGGVGKTTTTVGLGSTFAAIRGDRVIAVDANPDFGTLAQRGPDQSRSTVRDLLLDDNIFRYSDIRRHTSQSTSRLEILASERDPATSEAFSDADYRVVIRLLQRFYNLILTDCGTGLVHSAMDSVLDEADAIVLVASPAIDAARSALATLDWLEHHGRAHLVPNATVVISAARPGKSSVDLDMLAAQFLTRIRAVHVIPFDDHLAQGSEIVLDLMASRTRQAFLELAASIADGFAHTKRADRTSRG
jgi:MinD-like ATPase involved in chromosome partitioning or flagellar assembly